MKKKMKITTTMKNLERMERKKKRKITVKSKRKKLR
jgi:hypothetical protein